MTKEDLLARLTQAEKALQEAHLALGAIRINDAASVGATRLFDVYHLISEGITILHDDTSRINQTIVVPT